MSWQDLIVVALLALAGLVLLRPLLRRRRHSCGCSGSPGCNRRS